MAFGSPYTREELIGADLRWLLTVDVGGHVHRFSTQQITVAADSDGVPPQIRFESGLLPAEYSTELVPFEGGEVSAAVDLDGIDLRKFGSAGQVRAAMICLKFGKLTLLQEARGETPLLLMDDFDSDLDERRAKAVANFLNEGGFQAIVATSKEEMTDRLGVAFESIHVSDGRVSAT